MQPVQLSLDHLGIGDIQVMGIGGYYLPTLPAGFRDQGLTQLSRRSGNQELAGH